MVGGEALYVHARWKEGSMMAHGGFRCSRGFFCRLV